MTNCCSLNSCLITLCSCLAVGLPQVFVETQRNRFIIAVSTIPVICVIAAVFHYLKFTAPSIRIALFLDKVLQRIATKPSACCTTVQQKNHCPARRSVHVNAWHSDIYWLQANIKDLVTQYYLQQRVAEQFQIREKPALKAELPYKRKKTCGSNDVLEELSIGFVDHQHSDQSCSENEHSRSIKTCSPVTSSSTKSLNSPSKKTGSNQQSSINKNSQLPLESLMDSGSEDPSKNSADAAVAQPFTITRGGRFVSDHSGVVLYISRTTNGNLVVYESNEASLNQPDTTGRLHPSWRDIDPSYVAKAKSKGKADAEAGNASELSTIENKFAYGVNFKDVTAAEIMALVGIPVDDTGDKDYVLMKFVALPKRPMLLRMGHFFCQSADSTQPVVYKELLVLDGLMNGRRSIIEHIHVTAGGGLWPTVSQVMLEGVDVETNTKCTEVIKP